MNQCSLAYSQTKINVHPNDDEKRMNFTGKEKDSESGYHYFGARYYDSEALTGWLSVDPMSDKYPSISPYAYCAWNPVKLVDPNGRKIKNAYEQYKNITDELEYYYEKMKDDPANSTDYQINIDLCVKNHKKYLKVQQAINAFRNANQEEYDILDNLSYDGTEIDVVVNVDLYNKCGKGGGVGETSLRFLVDKTGTVQGFRHNSICVTLFKNAFRGGSAGLGAIANEFGDALFAISRPQYAYEQLQALHNKEHSYDEDPSANFSYDYEFYICRTGRKRPNPDEY